MNIFKCNTLAEMRKELMNRYFKEHPEFRFIPKNKILHRSPFSQWFYFEHKGKLMRCTGNLTYHNRRFFVTPTNPAETIEFASLNGGISKPLRQLLKHFNVPILHYRKIKKMKEKGLILREVLQPTGRENEPGR